MSRHLAWRLIEAGKEEITEHSFRRRDTRESSPIDPDRVGTGDECTLCGYLCAEDEKTVFDFHSEEHLCIRCWQEKQESA